MKEIHEDVFNCLIAEYNKDNKNFFFTTRKINREGRLDQGYWFLGNDNYLAVSFWTGMDKLNRTPRIYFKIKGNGETSIEFRNADVRNHYEYYHPNLIKEIGAIETPNGYSKKLKGTDYILTLFLFLLNEKKIIDSYIERPEFRDYSISEWADPIEFINPKSFKKQLEVINIYRERVRIKITDVGFFKGFTISNFGKINQISVDIPSNSRWIFLTGENGAGKTSILKAIATGLCQNNDLEERIATKSKYGDFSIDIFLESDYGATKTYTVLSNKSFKKKEKLVEGFAAYGPVRLVSNGHIDNKVLKNEDKIHNKATYGLFNPIGILKDLSDGYILNVKAKYHDLAVDSLIDNLSYILPNVSHVEESENGELIFCKALKNGNVEKITFDELPSGTRNFAALILDLLICFQNQQPEATDIADYVGVVLIDEIDIHLHPKLQIELVKQLSATFPKIQFIVSTHSPVTLLGAPDNSIFIKVINSQDKGIIIERLIKLEKDIKFLTPNTILSSDIFDFDFIENVSEDTFDKMYLEDDYEEIVKNQELNQRLKNLDKSIFPDNLFNKDDKNGL